MKVGKKEIKNALQNIKLTKKEYQSWKIDNMIMKYYNIPEETLLEDITEPSNEFEDINDVYEYIDKVMKEKGYIFDEIDTYVKLGEDKE